jgi:hypothetical protein
MTSESDEKPDEEAWLCNYGDLWVVASHRVGDICLARDKGGEDGCAEQRNVIVPLDTDAARQLIQALQYAIAAIESRPVKGTEEPQ